MTSRLTRPLTVALAALAVAAGAIVAVAPGADATAPQFISPQGFPKVVGDLTGDGVSDRLVLGSFEGRQVCAYQLARGLGNGHFATPVAAALPVQNTVPDGGLFSCPYLGTVLKGPTPAQNQLAATWYDFGPYEAPSVQTFKGFGTGAVRNTGGFQGVYQASSIRSVDFDGDGYGDAYEYTDQGGPDELWVGRGQNWHRLFTYPTGAYASEEQFLDLNGNGGTDVLTTWGSGSGQDYGVAVIDGRSGAVQVLDNSPLPDGVMYRDFALSVVDLDHDRRPDLQLLTYLDYDDGHQTVTLRQYVNQSSNGRWFFKLTFSSTA